MLPDPPACADMAPWSGGEPSDTCRKILVGLHPLQLSWKSGLNTTVTLCSSKQAAWKWYLPAFCVTAHIKPVRSHALPAIHLQCVLLCYHKTGCLPTNLTELQTIHYICKPMPNSCKGTAAVQALLQHSTESHCSACTTARQPPAAVSACDASSSSLGSAVFI